MEGVLNYNLYVRLRRHFGSVKVSNLGEKMMSTSSIVKMYGEKAKARTDISHAGEYYQVNCPYCNDTRHRLYVNHMFGQRDDFGRRMLFLAICYNEGCLSKRENQRDFVDRIDDHGLREAVVTVGKVTNGEAKDVAMPGVCTLLNKLPDSHPAKVYVTSRGFDPDVLAKKFSVSYCEESKFSLARDRIIIPIFANNALKGWQARYIGELAWKGENRRELPPKYFSCPNSDFRSKCIYNFDQMRKWETGIIVEGPTDAWNFGSMAGCIFGNTVTETQLKLFLSVFRKRTGVLLLDPEEYESASTQKLLNKVLYTMCGRFCAVKLPDGTDPGSLNRNFLREYVRDQAAMKGVKVTYRKTD